MSKGNSAPPDSAYKAASMYPGLQDPAKTAIRDAQSNYKKGWNTVPLNELQTGSYQGALGMLPQLGQAGAGIDFAAGVAGGGAVNGPGQQFMQGVYGAPTGGPYQQQLGQLAHGAAGQIDPSLAGIYGTAAGRNVGGYNPRLERVIGSTNADIGRAYTNATAPGIEGRMGMAGVAGSPMEGWATSDARRDLTDRLAANENQLRYGNYSTERGYQQQAQMGLPGAVGTAYGTAGGAAQGASGNWMQSLNQQLAAAQGAGNQYNQGVQTALGAGQGVGQQVQGQLGAYGSAMGLGQQQQQSEQAIANPQWQALNQYIQQLQGVGSLANPAAGAQAMQGYQSGGQQMFGNVMGVAGLAAKTAPYWAPMMMSDRRVKKDVEPAGLGSGLYRWRYLWEGEDRPRHLGPMAQDVAAVAPSAVERLDGLLAIPAQLVER